MIKIIVGQIIFTESVISTITMEILTITIEILTITIEIFNYSDIENAFQ
jgi:hypothetical protein